MCVLKIEHAAASPRCRRHALGRRPDPAIAINPVAFVLWAKDDLEIHRGRKIANPSDLDRSPRMDPAMFALICALVLARVDI